MLPVAALAAVTLLVLEIDPARLAVGGTAKAFAADPVIAAAGDVACPPSGTPDSNSCRQLDTSNLMTGGGLAAVLMLGDGQYESGELENYNASYEPSWGRVKSITRPVPGNHEYQTSGATGYYTYFGSIAGDPAKGYYSYDVGNWHLIALNSNCSRVSCSTGSTQEQWLRADLAANKRTCTLAYWHHARFSSGPHGTSTSVLPFWRALYDARADVVLVSHDHLYERFAPQNPDGLADPENGIRQFTVGTGGDSQYSFGSPVPNSEVRNSNSFGVLKMTLHPNGYHWQFAPIPEDNSFTDSGVARCENYQHPSAASPVQASLVPVFEQCGTGANPVDGRHSPPQAAVSCLPPVTSGVAHLGARATGTATVATILGNPANTVEDSDTSFSANITDVRAGSRTGADYNPSAGADVTLTPRLRITDSLSGPSQLEPGTTVDLTYAVPLNCAPTSDTTVGSTCSVSTSADALTPGMIVEGRKTVMQLFRLRVDDAGPNNARGDGDDRLFAQQGYYVP